MGAVVSKTPGLTADQRRDAIRDTTDEYLSYLSKSGGVVLTANERVRIAREVLTALDCPVSKNLPKEACLRKCQTIYATLAASKQYQTAVSHLVCSLVNHQGRLDQDWYERTMEKLKEEELVPASQLRGKDATQKEYLYNSLFAELLSIITCVHGLHMVTVVLGEPSLTIPDAPKGASPPNFVDWSSVFLPGKSAQFDPNVAAMPYIVAADIDAQSPALKKVVPEEQDRTMLTMGMNPMTPYVCMTWSPMDFVWICKINSCLYIDGNDFFSPHKPLAPSLRCSDHFTRRDVEIIALAVSDGYACGF